MFGKTKTEDEVHAENVIKLVEEQLGEREAAVKRSERDVAGKYARLNEMMNWVDAALRDAGHVKTAEILAEKVKGAWSAGEVLK